jgi:hypothetical protein
MKTVWEVAEALKTIRDERLYRAHYPTFEEFCAAELSMSGRRARQLSDASGVVRNLLGEGGGESGTIVPKWPEGGTKPSKPVVLPASESVARPLTRLEPEKQVKVWKQAVKAAHGGKVTAKLVEKLVEKEQGEVAPPDDFEALVLGHRANQRAVNKAVGKDQKWPKPDAHGRYDESESERIHFETKGGSATIYVLQIGPGEWIGAHTLDVPGAGYAPYLLSRGPAVLGNRNAAVEAAARKLLRHCNSWTQLDCEEAPRAVVKKLAEWAGKVLNVLKGAEIRAAPSEEVRKQVRERWKRSTEIEAISAAIERVEAEVQSLEMELFDYLEVEVDATLEGGFRKLKAALAGIEDRLRVMKVLPALGADEQPASGWLHTAKNAVARRPSPRTRSESSQRKP